MSDLGYGIARTSRTRRALAYFALGFRELMPRGYREAIEQADRRLGVGRRMHDLPPPQEPRAYAYRDRPFGRRRTD